MISCSEFTVRDEDESDMEEPDEEAPMAAAPAPTVMINYPARNESTSSELDTETERLENQC